MPPDTEPGLKEEWQHHTYTKMVQNKVRAQRQAAFQQLVSVCQGTTDPKVAFAVASWAALVGQDESMGDDNG